MKKVLGSGAEAIIYLEGTCVDKDRMKKNYRHPDIDSTLRKARTKKESKILRELEKHSISPRLIRQDDSHILMEYIDGIQLKKILDKKPALASMIGKNLTIMHDLNIIHGDLTTSNMILVAKGADPLKDKDARLYFIDFGLSTNSPKIEDKAVDIHLFKQALESKHFRVYEKAYEAFLQGYNPKDKKEILERLNTVEQRGRYKEKSY